MSKPQISTENQISLYLNCGKCIDEWKTTRPGVAPGEFARLNVGWTPRGLQVWCWRRDCNVCNVDFEGQKHPAVTEATT